MKKLIFIITSIFLFVSFLSITALAGTWKQDANGWWWDYGNGTFPKSTWEWCDGDNDGIAEYYYFNDAGYCLQNTTTPDGNIVNANGALVISGIIQTKRVQDIATVTPAAQTAPAAQAQAAQSAPATQAQAIPVDPSTQSSWDTHRGNISFTGHYYATPSGQCYHYSIECGGKNSREITEEQAKRLRPCGTCVLK